jgi:hypothetical protein
MLILHTVCGAAPVQHLYRLSIARGHPLDIEAGIECKGYITKKVIETYHLLISWNNVYQTLAQYVAACQISD